MPEDILNLAHPLSQQIQQWAEQEHIPLVDTSVAQMLYHIVKKTQPQYGLEVGFGSGFSTFALSQGCPSLHLITMEKKDLLVQQGKIFFQDYPHIDIQEGDALDLLKNISFPHLDLIFLDAAKRNYKKYLDEVQGLLRKGTILIADNLFMRGVWFSQEESSKNRQRQRAGMKDFIDSIYDSQTWSTLFLPISDGLSISIFLGNKN